MRGNGHWGATDTGWQRTLRGNGHCGATGNGHWGATGIGVQRALGGNAHWGATHIGGQRALGGNGHWGGTDIGGAMDIGGQRTLGATDIVGQRTLGGNGHWGATDIGGQQSTDIGAQRALVDIFHVFKSFVFIMFKEQELVTIGIVVEMLNLDLRAARAARVYFKCAPRARRALYFRRSKSRNPATMPMVTNS